MSLVERAIKKLQESAAHSGAPQRPSSAGRVVDAAPPPAAVAHETSPQRPQFARPSRIVNIDKEALRAMRLMPPATMERRTASQYQRIKRPLVAAALGKSDPPIENAHLIMLASALPGEGKTFTSINLALSLAREKDIEVLLVDADVAKPHVSRVLGVEAERGLLDLLTDSNLHAESVILGSNVPGLTILPAGKHTEAATELLASERMHQIAAQLAESGGGRRIVLFDSPPLLLSTESQALISSIGQVVLIVRAESTPRSAVMSALETLGDSKPISLILNQSSNEPEAGHYGYGPYGDAAVSEAGG
jgi:exopolysaccharide/PEP-CTERM locus tyrosine autokinase